MLEMTLITSPKFLYFVHKNTMGTVTTFLNGIWQRYETHFSINAKYFIDIKTKLLQGRRNENT